MVVNRDYRRLGASPQTGVVTDKQLPIWGVSFSFHPGSVQHCADERHGSSQVTRRPQTKLHPMLTGRVEPKIGIKRGHGPDIIDRRVSETGYLLHRFLGDVANLILNSQQR